jgi:hypothetical protein
MCFGSAPQAPEVRYVGPSQADIDANNAKLNQYRQDSSAQQQQFASALQKQIDDANASATAKRQELDALMPQKQRELDAQMAQKQREMDAQMTGATASAAAQQQAAYAVTTTQTEPVAAQTTTAPKKKDKLKGTLKIAPGATAASEGSGINIGV